MKVSRTISGLWPLGRVVLCGVFLLGGCGDKDAPQATAGMGSEGEMTDGSTTTGESATGETTTASSTTTGTTMTTTAATGDDPTGCSFIDCNDAGNSASQCDPLAQDCPEGEKCTAVSPMEGQPWGINQCVPVNGDAAAGDPCDIEGGKYTGLDNCGLGLICLLTDDDGIGGSCIEFCEPDLKCSNPGIECSVYNDGSLPICLKNCDPLLQDCDEGQACYPSAGENFVCFKVSVDIGEGGVGDGCNYINQCQAGLMCVSPMSVPNCNENGCCSPFCAISEGNGVCLEGQECVPYYEMGTAPPGYEDVGVCAIPA